MSALYQLLMKTSAGGGRYQPHRTCVLLHARNQKSVGVATRTLYFVNHGETVGEFLGKARSRE
jgi:hypothetical protein